MSDTPEITDKQRLDWIQDQRKGGTFHLFMGDYGVTLQSARHVTSGSKSVRETIDIAMIASEPGLNQP